MSKNSVEIRAENPTITPHSGYIFIHKINRSYNVVIGKNTMITSDSAPYNS